MALSSHLGKQQEYALQVFAPMHTMKKNDLLILLLALALLLAMILTYIFHGERSRHGYGAEIISPLSGKEPRSSITSYISPPGGSFGNDYYLDIKKPDTKRG